MLYLIGLGLEDEKSLSMKALEIIKKADFIFLEGYTSKLSDLNLKKMNDLFNKEVKIVNRDFVENTSNILNLAKEKDVVLLVIGDPMVATTHLELVLDSEAKKIPVRIINNVSVVNAVANLGLEFYKFGKTTSIPFTTKSFTPETPYDIIRENKSINAHTLCLLDLKPDENKFMTFNESLNYLLKIENKRKENVLSESTLVVACGALSTKDEKIIFGRIKDILSIKLNVFPQCLIIPSKLHFMEEKALKRFSVH